MSNLSGVEDNKAFKTGINPAEPYYYISAHLDLMGAEVGAPGNNYVYYFNKENNFNYLNSRLYPLGPDSYPGFYPIEDNAVIDEVVVYTGPDLQYSYNGGNISDLDFYIGGAYLPSIAEVELDPLDVWAGPTGNVAGPINGDVLGQAQVCRYGREPEFPDILNNKPSQSRKFLALNIRSAEPLPLIQDVQEQNEPDKNSKKLPRHQAKQSKGVQKPTQLGKVNVVYKEVKTKNRGRSPKIVRQVLTEDSIDSGMIYVVLKVYPKFQ